MAEEIFTDHATELAIIRGSEVELYEGEIPEDDEEVEGDGRRYVVPHDESFEGRDFLPAAQLESGAQLLILNHQEDFWHLKNTRILYLWKRVGGKERGKYRLGQAVKLAGVAAHLAGELARASDSATGAPQILIWLAANAHFGASDRQIESTLYHELLHIVLDDDGEPTLRGHDFEGFAREIEVFGLTTDDQRYMAEAFYRQAPLFGRHRHEAWEFRQEEAQS